MLKFVYFAILTTFLSGCSVREAVDFHVNEDLVLTTKMTKEEYQHRTVYSYELERPVAVTNPGVALIFEFPGYFTGAKMTVDSENVLLVEADLDGGFVAGLTGGADIADAVGFSEAAEIADDTEIADAAANAHSGPVTFAIPVSPGTKFDGFSLSYPAAGGAAGLALPVFAGFGPVVGGVFFEPASKIDTRIAVKKDIGNPHRTITFDVSRITGAATGLAGITVNYAFAPQEDGKSLVSITAEDAESSAQFSLRLRRGEKSIYLYEGMCGFEPAVVRIIIEGAGFSLKSLVVDEVSRDNGVNIAPIPIDMGGVVIYDRSRWRNGEFELFSWNLFPDILIIDTVSYAVQAEFFKRLAFFVEKAGTAGSLLPDSVISSRHGWNAHDYRAEDLARFFSRARTEDFELGDKEIFLREILVNRGIIHEAGVGWHAGKGGLITLSQESSPRLRELFMVHEGYHGIFFTDAEYREVSLAAWSDLSRLEQRFWREFLSLRDYNVYDEFLVVNEFQAYLMQVSHDVLEAYYWDYSVPALVEAVPRTAKIVEQLQMLHPNTFHNSALVLVAYLKEKHGFGASGLFCLELLRQ